jgi:hypothetical protein
MATIRAALDACVLYPAPLRDTLLGAAVLGLYEPLWSREILQETVRNLVADGRMTPEGSQRLEANLLAVFPTAVVASRPVSGDDLAVHPKDRHVAATAIAAGANCLVTLNLRDFPEAALAPYGVVPIAPDDFLAILFRQDPEGMVAVLRNQQAKLKSPPVTMDEVLRTVGLSAPGFVELVRPLLVT